MDNYCQKCAEPWDIFSVNEFSVEYDGGTSKDFYNGKGCPCCNWGKDNIELNNRQKMTTDLMSICRDLLGDDIDGMASIMDDAEYLGFLD